LKLSLINVVNLNLEFIYIKKKKPDSAFFPSFNDIPEYIDNNCNFLSTSES